MDYPTVREGSANRRAGAASRWLDPRSEVSDFGTAIPQPDTRWRARDPDGLGLVAISGAMPALFGSGGVLPDLQAFTARETHEAGVTILLWLIGAHVALALWHHVVRRDATLKRMLGMG